MGATGREWIIDDRPCVQCGSEYRSLSQHWTKARDCDHRPLSDHQYETVRGLLLGDGFLGNDEYRLDSDGDGEACESLP